MNVTADFLCWQLVGGERDYAEHMRRVHPWAMNCRCPRTVECEWQGDGRGIALMSGDVVYRDQEGEKSYKTPVGKVIRYGGLSLRVLDMRLEGGLAYDQFYVALANNPHGDLQVLYRRAARALLRVTVNLEARVRGFMLQPVEGREMSVASWLAKRML